MSVEAEVGIIIPHSTPSPPPSPPSSPPSPIANARADSDRLVSLSRARYSRKKADAKTRRDERRKYPTAPNTEASKRKDKEDALFEDISAFWAKEDAFIKEMSEKHKVKIADIERKVQRLGDWGKSRKPNAWNAYLHATALEKREAGNLMTFGEHNMKVLVEQARSAGGYMTYTAEEHETLTDVLLTNRKETAVMPRQKPKAQAYDVTSTTKRVDNELVALADRAPIGSMRMTIKKSPDLRVQPSLDIDPDLNDAILALTGVRFNIILPNIEGYLLARHNRPSLLDHDLLKSSLKTQALSLLRTSLLDKTRGKVKSIPWSRLQKLAVDYALELINWPFDGPIKEPSARGIEDLSTLLDAVQANTCRWELMSDASHQELLATVAPELAKKKKTTAKRKAAPTTTSKATGKRARIRK